MAITTLHLMVQKGEKKACLQLLFTNKYFKLGSQRLIKNFKYICTIVHI